MVWRGSLCPNHVCAKNERGAIENAIEALASLLSIPPPFLGGVTGPVMEHLPLRSRKAPFPPSILSLSFLLSPATRKSLGVDHN